MDSADIEILAQAIARAVRDALEGLTITVDKAQLGSIAAEAINENRMRQGKAGLDL